MKDGKFHPHTDYKKGIRKSRDQKDKTQGVKVERKARIGHIDKEIPRFAIKEFDDSGIKDLEATDYNPKWKLFSAFDIDGHEFFIFPDEESAIAFGRQSIRDTATEYIPDEGTENYDEWKNLNEDELVEKIIEEQSDFGLESELSAVAKSVAGYDGQYTETSSGWIAFQTSG